MPDLRKNVENLKSAAETESNTLIHPFDLDFD